MLVTSSPSSWSLSQERSNNVPLSDSALTRWVPRGSGGTWRWGAHLSMAAQRWSRSNGGKAKHEGMFKLISLRLSDV